LSLGGRLLLELKHLLHLVLLVEVGHQVEPRVDALEVLLWLCVEEGVGGKG
jgi:hypothetical protein